MAFEFTPGLERALSRAAAWAKDRQEIEPWHLLLGLIEDDEAVPFLALVESGLLAERLKELVHEAPAEVSDPLPLAAATRSILHHAQSLTRSISSQATIPSDQVLLALVRQAAEVRARLEALGLDFARLSDKIQPARPAIRLAEPLELLEMTDQVDLARVLDASANRAREALRVLEDYGRFVLNDELLTRQLKTIRHDLTQALAELPEHLLLAGRDTGHDVGTEITTAQEFQRGTVADVLQANARRLQEALRSLEEYGKVLHPGFGEAIEQLRYRIYTAERALTFADQGRLRLGDARLYVLVTERLARHSLYGTVAEILAGGAQIVQLREKGVDDRGLLEKAREIRKMTRAAGALFIVNDRPDIARLVEADGVHLGQDDMPLQEARRIVGPRALIGISAHNVKQVRQAVEVGASYIGVGPTFASATKDFTELAGLDFVRAASAATSLPAFVLGGVKLENVPDILAAGGKRVAVSHAVCGADDPRRACAEFRRLLAQ